MNDPSADPSRLRHSILRLFSGNVIFAAAQWAVVIAIAKIAGVGAVGIYALANAITAPVFGFASLGLRPSLSSDARHSHALSTYFRLGIIGSGIALVGCVLGGLVLEVRSTLFWCIVGLAIARAAENGSVLISGLHQKHEQMSLIGRSLALRGTVGIGVVVTCLWVAPERIEFAVIGLGLAWLAVLLGHDIVFARGAISKQRLWERATDSITRDDMRSLLLVVWPVAILMLVTTLIRNVPRYWIEEVLGTQSLGYFAAIMQFAVAGSIIINSITQAVLPRLSKLFLSNRRAYVKLLGRAVALAIALGAMGIGVAALLGKPVLRLIYTADFVQHVDTLVVAMVYTLFLYVSVTLGSAMTAMRSFRSQLVIGCATLAGTALGAVWLVPKLGIVGGAWALAIGVVVKIVLQAATIFTLVRRPLDAH